MDCPSSLNQTKAHREKCLISIPWSVKGIYSGFHVPNGTVDNTTLFTDVVIPGPIENMTSMSYRKTLKGWAIHIDKTRPHNPNLSQERIKASKVERLSHPVYSPAIVQTDFLLLESLKEKCITTVARASQTY
jgi:hypothetical protein